MVKDVETRGWQVERDEPGYTLARRRTETKTHTLRLEYFRSVN